MAINKTNFRKWGEGSGGFIIDNIDVDVEKCNLNDTLFL